MTRRWARKGGLEKKSTREKKRWGFGKSKHGEFSSFIPLYREPSSIEKILEDAENEQHQRLHLVPSKKIQQSKSPALKPAVIPNYVLISATRIQAAYRGYKKIEIKIPLHEAGEAELPSAEGTNATSKSHERAEREASDDEHHAMHADACSSAVTNTQQEAADGGEQEPSTPPHSGNEREGDGEQLWRMERCSPRGYGEWDDSLLTKAEEEARMRRKEEAVIKRERALAYAYSHQVTPRSAEAMMTGLRSGSAPWWWTWLERQLPSDQAYAAPPVEAPWVQTPRFFAAGLPRTTPAPAPQRPHRHRSRRRYEDADDASLTSCPPFEAPNYMAPTASAKAKVKSHHANQEPKKKRFSFALGQSIGSLFGGKETMGGGGCGAGSGCGGSQRTGRRGKHRSMESVGGMSIDSIVSLPAGAVAGRRSFA
ncbi:hypothetical protein GW17_00012594 [Ensete ventricosum]|nr:hypothetical protein GW17_00012594 [Ensete ventricosum]